MTAIAYTIRQTPTGFEIQSSADLESGAEIKKRLAKWLNLAVESAMLEIRARVEASVVLEKEGIATLARAACKSAMENDWPEGLPRL